MTRAQRFSSQSQLIPSNEVRRMDKKERKGKTERWLLFRQRERRKKERLRYEISVRIGESQMTEIGRDGEERRNRSHVD